MDAGENYLTMHADSPATRQYRQLAERVLQMCAERDGQQEANGGIDESTTIDD